MNGVSNEPTPASNMVTFYHDIEQDIGIRADPEVCRRVVREFLRLERKYEVPATYNIVAKLFQEQPDFIEQIAQNKEVAFHSYHHQSDWKPDYYSTEIDLCRKASSLPRGYRSPRSEWNRAALETMWRNGFLWNAEIDTSKEPYFIYAGLVRLPIATDDWPIHSGALSEKEWIQQFSVLLKTRRYFAVGSHDCVTSLAPEERLKTWETILRRAIEAKVLLVTFSEAADLFRRAMLSQFYSRNAKPWNRDTRPLYRTNRFAEVIRAEARRIDQPVIADLGSGGGVLSSPLRDIAKRIYCVDNARGMIAEVDSNSVIQPILGEVTDSGLQDDSIDLVVCARVIEYLFDPDHLADEIKRIGKAGATCIVTFPAQRETVRSHEASKTTRYRTPDERIRHYFSPDEIKKWAGQIGPGRLIGIQYDSREPDNPVTEERYRAIENNPPVGACPTNWVYVGTIQNKPLRVENYRRTIPLSAFEFRGQGGIEYRIWHRISNIS